MKKPLGGHPKAFSNYKFDNYPLVRIVPSITIKGRLPSGKSIGRRKIMSNKFIYQSAKTGKIVSPDYAKKNPDTTIKHTVKK